MTKIQSSQATPGGQGQEIKNLFSAPRPRTKNPPPLQGRQKGRQRGIFLLFQRWTATMTVLVLTVGCLPIQKPQARYCLPGDVEALQANNPEKTEPKANNPEDCPLGNCDTFSSAEAKSAPGNRIPFQQKDKGDAVEGKDLEGRAGSPINIRSSKQYQPALATERHFASTFCAQIDPFNESVKYALQGSRLAQSARTKEDWDAVAAQWVQAVAWMQAVPVGSPKRAFAEKKVAEYMRNLTYSQQKAASTRSQLPSFNSDLLDRQLELYLSYTATVGPPDVLILGSSRALQGVDPRQIQQVLAARGLSGVKIFNFGVNGATARVVDFQLRQLLSADLLPRLIIWADGVRAFNNGRTDKTYNAIASSEGKRLLVSGIRPQLPQTQFYYSPKCYQFPHPSCQLSKEPRKELLPVVSVTAYSEVALSNSPESPLPTNDDGQKLITDNPPVVVAQASLEEIAQAIDANGFLSVSTQFNPSSYYRQRPYVAGKYDRDYAGFYLGGAQAAAFNSILEFTKARRIPLVFVNLPLTDNYLDSVRWSAEKQFASWMRSRSRQHGFVFLDLNLEPQLARNNYFVDPSHLNRYGAIAVSRRIASDRSIPWSRSR